MKTIIVGDVHGCKEELVELLEKTGYRQGKDLVVLAGDLVDRGPDSAGVVRLARDVGALLVVGNHDEKYVRYEKHLLKQQANPAYVVPLKLNEAKQKVFKSLSNEDLRYIEAAPVFKRLTWNDRDVIVVHGGLWPRAPEKQDAKMMIRLRFLDKDTGKPLSLMADWSQPPNSVYWTSLWDQPELVFYGHNVGSLDHPVITERDGKPSTVGLDTGCCFGGQLTAAVLEDGVPEIQFVSVKAHSNTIEYANWLKKNPTED